MVGIYIRALPLFKKILKHSNDALQENNYEYNLGHVE